MRAQITIGALIGAALLWAGVSAQQETRATPGFGSGLTKVVGTVDIGNAPEVQAAQRGEWRVAVANSPAVSVSNRPTVVVASADFLRKDARYAIIWPTGEREQVIISEVGSAGWVEVDQPGSLKRWINLSVARSVEQASQPPRPEPRTPNSEQ